MEKYRTWTRRNYHSSQPVVSGESSKGWLHFPPAHSTPVYPRSSCARYVPTLPVTNGSPAPAGSAKCPPRGERAARPVLLLVLYGIAPHHDHPTEYRALSFARGSRTAIAVHFGTGEARPIKLREVGITSHTIRCTFFNGYVTRAPVVVCGGL